MEVITAPSPRVRKWFDQGHEAFVRTFPNFSPAVPFSPFYVCPLCLRAGGEEALANGWLSREDVPPKSIGGKKIVLTCAMCNSTAGHTMDAHLRREANFIAFMTRTPSEMRAVLRTTGGRLPVQLHVTEGGIQLLGVPKATHPDNSKNVQEDFSRAVPGDNWKDFTFNVEFESFSPQRAATGWLRSAYLAFFAVLGYRFVCRPELEVVRQRIKTPESSDHFPFRVIHPTRSIEPTLMRVDEPKAFRSYLMVYKRNLVFLPRYNDHELYNRLAEQPAGDVNFSGILYPWPDRPLFLHDYKSTSPQ